MAAVTLIVAAIILIISLVMLGIASGITGGLSTQKMSPLKQQLLAVSALTGFTGILFIILIITGFIWNSARKNGRKSAKGLGIFFLILLIIIILMYIVILVIILIIRNNSAFDNTQKGALTTVLILIPISLVLMIIGAIVLRAAIKI